MDKKHIPLDKLPLPSLSKATQTVRQPEQPRPVILTYLDEYFAPSFIKSYFKV